MNNIADQQDVIFYDLLINYFMNNPALYDKMEENYAITVEKLEKLLILSSYLKELDITKSVPEIINAWKGLVKQFKKHLAEENKAGSGSGATNNEFPYYQQLMFLKPAIQHRTTLSTINLSLEQNMSNTSTFPMASSSQNSCSTASKSWIPSQRPSIAKISSNPSSIGNSFMPHVTKSSMSRSLIPSQKSSYASNFNNLSSQHNISNTSSFSMASFDNISSAAARSLKLSGRASVANTSCTLYSNPSSDGNSLMPPITNKGSAPSTSSSLIPIQKSLRVPNYDNLSLQHNISNTSTFPMESSSPNSCSTASKSWIPSQRPSVAKSSGTLSSNPSSAGNYLMPPVTNKGSASSMSRSLISTQKSLRVPDFDESAKKKEVNGGG